MKISDREKKIILIVAIALIVALPFLLIIKPTNEKTEGLEGEIAQSTTRRDELKVLYDQEQDFIDGIAKMNAEMEEITKGYAEGVKIENTIMFLRGIEFDIPMFMETVSFAGTMMTPLSAGSVDENGNVTGAADGLKAQTSVVYVCDYEAVKSLLEFIAKYPDRMVIPSMSISYDGATGLYSGSFVLNQFAITGDGRELDEAKIPSMMHGNESIFGTYITDEELKAALEEAAGETSDEAETEEE